MRTRPNPDMGDQRWCNRHEMYEPREDFRIVQRKGDKVYYDVSCTAGRAEIYSEWRVVHRAPRSATKNPPKKLVADSFAGIYREEGRYFHAPCKRALVFSSTIWSLEGAEHKWTCWVCHVSITIPEGTEHRIPVRNKNGEVVPSRGVPRGISDGDGFDPSAILSHLGITIERSK